MKKFLIAGMVCSLGFGMFFTRCSQLLDPKEQSRESLVEEVKVYIASEDSLFTLDSFNDASNENLLSDNNGGLGRRMLAWRMRRKVTEANKDVAVDVLRYDSALVTIMYQVAGSLFVGIDTTEADRVMQADTLWTKPFDITAIRKVIVVKREFPESLDVMMRMGGRHNGWRMVAMTPLIGESAGSDLEIITLTIVNTTRGDTLSVKDPLSYFMSRREGPFFVWGDSIVVDVDVTNEDNSGERVIVHYPAPFMDRKVVHNLPVTEAVYQKGWRLRRYAGMWRVTVDVIDADLLTLPDARYNAVFLRLPSFIFPERLAANLPR